ncbi:YceI family protein [Telluribacter sp. SYSU D00476]|uniref:YceI family protein n=1 Tax=Telluribacter sp. SYSU D00476 TaxID=2811430 RepID=UPI001FF61400|nr:YceI family protein [Telluribacter sp. SYSU D00476]
MKKQFLSALAASLLLVACNPDEVTKVEQYSLNKEVSVAEWKGSTAGTFNNGSFAVESEDLEVADGKVTKGTFVIPIASIKNFNLPDAVKPQLLDHLKSPDFFNMALHPNATFTIKNVVPLTSPGEGAITGANYLVTGDFSMIGKTNTISFPARIDIQNKKLKTEATFKIDRTKWGMNYATDPSVPEHYIYPEVDIHLKLEGNME